MFLHHGEAYQTLQSDSEYERFVEENLNESCNIFVQSLTGLYISQQTRGMQTYQLQHLRQFKRLRKCFTDLSKIKSH